MTPWITVDDETSSALHSRLPEHTTIKRIDGSALEHALRRSETTVAVVPCPGLGQSALAVFRWNRTPAPALVSPNRTRAGGFLGLADEAEFEEPEEKKSWWKRWWEG
jgi:hypothetical protein